MNQKRKASNIPLYTNVGNTKSPNKITDSETINTDDYKESVINDLGGDIMVPEISKSNITLDKISSDFSSKFNNNNLLNEINNGDSSNINLTDEILSLKDETLSLKDRTLLLNNKMLAKNQETLSENIYSSNEEIQIMSLGEVESIDKNSNVELRAVGLYDIIDKRHNNIIKDIAPSSEGCLFRHKYDKRYVDVYSKGLSHDNNGFVDVYEIRKFLTSIKNHEILKLNKFENLSTIWTKNTYSYEIEKFSKSAKCSFNSHIMTAQMVELYCLSLARDINFNQYHINKIISQCCEYINNLKVYPQTKGKVTPYNIFRGPLYSDIQCTYVSQFLYRDIKIGGFTNKQKYITDIDGCDFMEKWETAISAQSGIFLEKHHEKQDKPRYIITGRDLAHVIRNNNVTDILLGVHTMILNMNIPKNKEFKEYIDKNGDIIYFTNYESFKSILMFLMSEALLVSNKIKWNTLSIRPESYAIEVERVLRDTLRHNEYKIPIELLRNPVIQHNGNGLLSQTSSYGAPFSPSGICENGAMAGVFITLIKIFFDTSCEINVYEPDTNGYLLIETDLITTVGTELEKLACNIASASKWSGINYHQDMTRGIRLGEKIAINYVKEIFKSLPDGLNIHIKTVNEKISSISN